MIRIDGTALYQWDTGRYVTTDIEADHVHFSNKGDSKAVIMDLADSQAKIPDYLLQTGKQLCVYVVRNGITVESKVFSVIHRERPENYIYEEDQRNFVYALIADAQAATEAANKAAEVAGQAGQSADGAANRASAAAESAEKASADANEAADKAIRASNACMVIGKASGENIVLDDATEQYLMGLRIFGKTTQDGVPTPDSPVELVSPGDGGLIILEVTGEGEGRIESVATPNGLPGIPVTSGGNYTDANGQQWICDEIDFERGKLVVRILSEAITGMPQFRETPDWIGRFVADNCLSAFCKSGRDNSLSNFAKFGTWGYGDNEEVFALNSRSLYYHPKTTMTADEVTALFADMIASETPPVVMGQLETPIEIDLSEDELAAYASLHTYKDHTTVSNDAGAYMELEYVMDAKKYIDGLITGSIVPATVE